MKYSNFLFASGIIFALALSAYSNTALAGCHASIAPRYVVHVASYGGAVTGEAANKLSLFVGIMNNKSDLWKEDIIPLAPQAQFLQRFTLFLDQNTIGSGPQITGTQAYALWQNHNDTLEVFYGIIAQEGDHYVVHSSVELGDLTFAHSPTIFRVTFPLLSSQYGLANDSHSLLVYYGLGLETLHLQCPAAVTAALLSRANEKASDLLTKSLSANEKRLVVQVRSTISAIMGQLH